MTEAVITMFFEDPSGSLSVKFDSQRVKMYKLLRTDEYEKYTFDLSQPAVYVLFGMPMRTGGRKMYIGQTSNARKRMRQHKARKEFWCVACVFVNDGVKYTSTDTQYLEYMLIKAAMEYGQSALLENCQIPKIPVCRAEDVERLNNDFNTFLQMLTIIGINPFNLKLCDVGDIDKHAARTVARRVAREYLEECSRPSQSDDDYSYGYCDEEVVTHYMHKDGVYDAQAMKLSDGRIYVFSHGCIAPPSGGTRDSQIAEAVKNGQLAEGSYEIVKDMIFDTPEDGQMFISGYGGSGRWRPPFSEDD